MIKYFCCLLLLLLPLGIKAQVGVGNSGTVTNNYDVDITNNPDSLAIVENGSSQLTLSDSINVILRDSYRGQFINMVRLGVDNTGATDASARAQVIIDSVQAAHSRSGAVFYFPAQADAPGIYTLYRGLIFQSSNVWVLGDGIDNTKLLLSNPYLHLSPDFKSNTNEIDSTTSASIVYLAAVPEAYRKRFTADRRALNFNDNGLIGQQLWTAVNAVVDKDSLTYFSHNTVSHMSVELDTSVMFIPKQLFIKGDSSAITTYALGSTPMDQYGERYMISMEHADTSQAYSHGSSFLQQHLGVTIKIGAAGTDIPDSLWRFTNYGLMWVDSNVTINTSDTLFVDYTFVPWTEGIKALGILRFKMENVKLRWFAGFGVEARTCYEVTVNDNSFNDLLISNGTNAVNGGFTGEYTILGMLSNGTTWELKNYEKLGNWVVTNNIFVNVSNISIDLENAGEFTHRLVEYPEDFEFNHNFIIQGNRAYNSGGFGLEAGSKGNANVSGNSLEDTGEAIHIWHANSSNSFFKTELGLTNTPKLFQKMQNMIVANNNITRATKGIVAYGQGINITDNVILDVGYNTTDRYSDNEVYGSLWIEPDPYFEVQNSTGSFGLSIAKGIELGNIDDFEPNFAPHSTNMFVVKGNVITAFKNYRQRILGNQKIDARNEVLRTRGIDLGSAGTNLAGIVSNNLIMAVDEGLCIKGFQNLKVSDNVFWNAGLTSDIVIERNSVIYSGGTNETELRAYYTQAQLDSAFEKVTPKNIQIKDNDFYRGPFFYQQVSFSGLPASLETDIADFTKYSFTRSYFDTTSAHWLLFQVRDTTDITENTIKNVSITGNTYTVDGTANGWDSFIASELSHSSNPRSWVTDWQVVGNFFRGDSVFSIGDTSSTGNLFEASTVTGTEKAEITFLRNHDTDGNEISLYQKFATDAAAITGGLYPGAAYDSLGVIRIVQ